MLTSPVLAGSTARAASSPGRAPAGRKGGSTPSGSGGVSALSSSSSSVVANNKAAAEELLHYHSYCARLMASILRGVVRQRPSGRQRGSGLASAALSSSDARDTCEKACGVFDLAVDLGIGLLAFSDKVW